MAEYLLRTDRCVDDECHQLWQLALAFAPTKTFKAKILRAKFMFYVGQHDQACAQYHRLLPDHSDNCLVLNNIGVCYVTAQDVANARKYYFLASLATGCEQFQHIPLANIERLGTFRGNFLW